MVRFQHALVIRCAPEVVFSWIEDPERARQWQPDVAGGEVLHAEPGIVGTEFREVLADRRGHVEMHGRITEFRPGTSMAVRRWSGTLARLSRDLCVSGRADGGRATVVIKACLCIPTSIP